MSGDLSENWSDQMVAQAQARRSELMASIAPTLSRIAEAERVLAALGVEVEPFRLGPDAGLLEPTAEPLAPVEPVPGPTPQAPPEAPPEPLAQEPEPEPEPEPEAPPVEPSRPVEPAARELPDEVPPELRNMPAMHTDMPSLKTKMQAARKEYAVYHFVEEHGPTIAPEAVAALEAGELGVEMAPTQVGRHLRSLEDAGLLRRTGRTRYSAEVEAMRAIGRMGGRTSIEFDLVSRQAVQRPPEPPPAPEREPEAPPELSKDDQRKQQILEFMRERGNKGWQVEIGTALRLPSGKTGPLLREMEEEGLVAPTGGLRKGRGAATKEWGIVQDGKVPEPTRPKTPSEQYAEGRDKVVEVFREAEPNTRGWRCVAQVRVARAIGISDQEATNLLREMQRRGMVRATDQMVTVRGPGGDVHSPVWRWVGPDFEEAEPDVSPEPEPGEQEAEGNGAVQLTASLEAVRDAAIREFGEDVFSAGQLCTRVEGWTFDETLENLKQLVATGTLQDESPTPDLNMFRWERPKTAGRAAELDIERAAAARAAAAGSAASDPVAGTGKLVQPSNPEVKKLVSDIRQQGGEARPAGSGHWEVLYHGMRQLIAGTPRSSRTVENDRHRLRRTLGLAL